MLWLNQVFLLVIITLGRKTCQKGGMTHQYNFFVIFYWSALKVMPKEFSELETSFVHFEGILHSVREFIVCKLQ
jgi:hypothetical protein